MGSAYDWMHRKLEHGVGCLQEEGPTEADVSSLRSIEQRNWENLQQENAYWQEMLTSTYMSRSYQMVSKQYSSLVSICMYVCLSTYVCLTASAAVMSQCDLLPCHGTCVSMYGLS